MTVLIANWGSLEEGLRGGAEQNFELLRQLCQELGEDVQVVTYRKAAGALGIPLQLNQLPEPLLYGGRIIGEYLAKAEAFLEPSLIIKKNMIAWKKAAELTTPQITMFEDVHHVPGAILYEAGYYNWVRYIQHTETYPELQRLSGLGHPNWTVTLSQFAQDRLRERLIPVGHVIEPPVDMTLFHPGSPEYKNTLRDRLGIPREQPVALWVGRFHPQKGWHIVRDCIHQFPQVYFVLVFVEGRKATPWCKNVQIVAPRPRAAMPELYQLADFFLLPSCGETANLSLVEAAACGLPCVTQRTGSWAHDPPRELGIFLHEWSSDAYAGAMQEMLDSLPTFPFAPREVVKARFDLPRWKAAIRALIDKAKTS